ncbi:MAG: HNH endonuclease [Candidatus Eremiobacteraeota bacterium]|nr:HNH endonuclease [Candidatus Eremiobacteraeota bacterium]
MKSYYRRNRARALEYSKRYYLAHREKVNERNRANHRLTRLVHGDALRAHKREYQKANPDKSRVQDHRRRTRLKGLTGQFTEKEWSALIARQKSRCALCQRKCKLSADHIIPISLGGCSYIWNIQGLCPSCNSQKHAKLPKGAQFGLFDRPLAMS